MNVYVAGDFGNATQVQQVYSVLRERGHVVTYPWADTPSDGRDKDEDWCRRVAEEEIEGVAESELLIVVGPGGRGTHCELGAALAMYMPVLLCSVGRGPEYHLFYQHPLVQTFVQQRFDPVSIVDMAETWKEKYWAGWSDWLDKRPVRR